MSTEYKAPAPPPLKMKNPEIVACSDAEEEAPPQNVFENDTNLFWNAGSDRGWNCANWLVFDFEETAKVVKFEFKGTGITLTIFFFCLNICDISLLCHNAYPTVGMKSTHCFKMFFLQFVVCGKTEPKKSKIAKMKEKKTETKKAHKHTDTHTHTHIRNTHKGDYSHDVRSFDLQISDSSEGPWKTVASKEVNCVQTYLCVCCIVCM